MIVAELRAAHYQTDLVKVARHITGHDRVSLICDEKFIHVNEIGKDGFSVEWIGSTNHKATAAAIEARLAAKLKANIEALAAAEGKTELEIITQLQAAAALTGENGLLEMLCELKWNILFPGEEYN